MYEPPFWDIFDSNWNKMTGIIIGGRYGRAKDNLSIKMYLTLTPIVPGPRPAAVSTADYRLQRVGAASAAPPHPWHSVTPASDVRSHIVWSSDGRQRPDYSDARTKK